MIQLLRISIVLMAALLLVSISDVAVALVTNVTALQWMACQLEEQECRAEGLPDKTLTVALSVWPTNNDLLRREGILRLTQGDHAAALAAFDKVEQPDAVTRFYLAQALYESGQRDEAIRLWREVGAGRYFAGRNNSGLAVMIGPAVFDLFYQLGEQAWAQGKAAEAVDYYRQALTLTSSESLGSLLIQVRVYEFEQRWADAEQIYKGIIQLYPGETVAYVYLGRLYEQHLAQPDSALEWYDRCIDLGNCFELAYLWAGDIYLGRNQPAEALTYYEAAVRRWPQNPWAWMGFGLVQVALGDNLPAIESFHHAERLFGALAVPTLVLYGLGKAYLQLGEWEVAADYLNHSIESGNHSVDAYLLLAKAYCMRDSNSDAIASYQAVLAIEPGNASALSGLEAVTSGSGCP